MLSLGMLIEHHVITFYKKGRRLFSGLGLVLLFIWLSLSGYMLYYLSEDSWRQVFSLGHWISGLIVIVFIAMHLLTKKY